jgi:hypothetical protein
VAEEEVVTMAEDRLAKRKLVAIDFDGTLHRYTKGWIGAVPDDEPPTQGAVDALRALKMKGYDIVVFTVRAEEPGGVEGIQAWLSRYGLAEYIDGITSVKPKAVAFIDDRGVPFSGDWLSAIQWVDKIANQPAREHRSI